MAIRTFKILLLGCTFLAAIPQASGAPISFDFDCVTGNCVNGGDLANHGVKPNANKAQDILNIKNYMNLEFQENGVDNSVTFINTGTKSKRGGTPDGHPGAGKPYLGNTDGATDRDELLTVHPSVHTTAKDTYLYNHWNGANTLDQKDRIIIRFENPIPWVAFDWEIFPQTSFVNADLTVLADGIQIFFRDLTTFRCDAGSLSNGALKACKKAEVEKGDLGHFDHFDFNTSNPAWVAAGGGNGGVTELQFVDWTHAPVGIDNLEVGVTVPEPSTLLLLGAGLASFGWWKRRKNWQRC